jgi:hypothetical protein
MQIEKAQSGRLIVSMMTSMVIGAVCLLCILMLRHNNIFYMLFYITVAAYKFASIYFAYQIEETNGPMVALSPRGIVLNGALSPSAVIPWHDVRRMRVTSLRFNYIFPIPFTAALTITLENRTHLQPLLQMLPHGWFSTVRIPQSYVSGGKGAMLRFVAGFEDYALEKRIAPDAVRATNGDVITVNPEVVISREPPRAQPASYPEFGSASAPHSAPTLNGQPFAPPRPAGGGFGRKRV